MESITIKLDEEEIVLTKEKVEKECAGGKKITDEAFSRFANLCKHNKLNPFTREAYIIVSEWSGKTSCQIMIGKEGYFKMADSNPNYDGMDDGIICADAKGNIVELEGCFVPPNHKLLGGWAKAYAKNRTHGKVAKVNLSEYSTQKSLWATKPSVMINKVAKVTALRDLFPQTFAGTYAEGEITEDDFATVKPSGTKKAQISKPAVATSSSVSSKIVEEQVESQASSEQSSEISEDVVEALGVEITMLNKKTGKEGTYVLGSLARGAKTLEQQKQVMEVIQKEAMKKDGSPSSEACKKVFLAIKNGAHVFPAVA